MVRCLLLDVLMSRPRRANRATISDTTLTLRLTREDREVLDCILEHESKLVTEHGFATEPTLASCLRGLIRREAQRLGLEVRHDEEGKASCARRGA
jgi:hypothetical protein